MSDLYERFIKMKASKASKAGKMGRVNKLKTPDGVGASGTSPSSDGATPYSPFPTNKRQKTQGTPDLQPIVTDFSSADNIFCLLVLSVGDLSREIILSFCIWMKLSTSSAGIR